MELFRSFDYSKLVTSRNITPVEDKPEGFSKEARDLWWDLVRDCIQQSPAARPDMLSVVVRLNVILKLVKGFLILIGNILPQSNCIYCCTLVFHYLSSTSKYSASQASGEPK